MTRLNTEGFKTLETETLIEMIGEIVDVLWQRHWPEEHTVEVEDLNQAQMAFSKALKDQT